MPKPGETLAIYEEFYAWQGEGLHAGRAAYFIRTYGCPLKCNFCDSAGTWHPDFKPDSVQRVHVKDLADRARSSGAAICITTGGEPAVNDLRPLVSALRERGVSPHLETSGAFPIHGIFDWLVVSPKWAKLPVWTSLERADEIKLIIEKPDDIEKWWEVIQLDANPRAIIRLHPEWSKRTDPEILTAISNAVKAYPRRYRAGYQTHRLYNVDSLDPNSKPAVPLGGRKDAEK